MLVRIPNLLNAGQVAFCREELARADWADGRGSAGYLAQAVKNNHQLPDENPVGRKLGELVLQELQRNEQFTAAALPQKLMLPLFNRYQGGQTYGRHIDGAVRQAAGLPYRIRTDLSATLFLSDPDAYDGGELVIEDTYGSREVKLAAGDMVLYPGTSVHFVRPVTRGERLASFFWIQSMVREDQKRSVLFELDRSIQKIATEHPGQPALTDLAGVYHNLLRLWAEL